MQAVAVDHSGREDVHGDALGARDDCVVELLARRAVELLRVVEEAKRSCSMLAEAVEVEQHTRTHEWPRERPTAGLVGTGDEPPAEFAVERQELPACELRHAGEDSPAPRR